MARIIETTDIAMAIEWESTSHSTWASEALEASDPVVRSRLDPFRDGREKPGGAWRGRIDPPQP